MRNRLLIFAGIILIGINLSSIYNNVVISTPQEKFEKIKRKFYASGNRISANFELPKDAYLLQITHKIDKNIRRDIFFNGIKFSANIFHYRRERHIVETSYIRLPKEAVNQGKNNIEIVFSSNLGSDVKIRFTNYRKWIVDIGYILFADSAYLPAGKFLITATSFTNILILLSWIMAYFLVRRPFVSKNRLIHFCQRYLLLLICVFLFFWGAGWLSANVGYRVVVASGFFWEFVFTVLTPFFAIGLYKILTPISLTKATEFVFKERKFDLRIIMALSFLIIIVNLWVYWPSFFHLFRHDEWFFFFSSKDEMPNLQFIIEHIDWQLRLPYDRLNFRPTFTGGLALNRVLFDTNYIGPHILSLLKHLVATFLLWCVMWQTKRTWLSAFFALLFSVLITGVDPVIWPHVDAYITTTIFILSAMLVFGLMTEGKISPNLGLYIVSIAIFLGISTTQLALVVPFILFAIYRFVIGQQDNSRLKIKSKWVYLSLFLPLLLWGIFFLIHLYFAYPFNMTIQSKMISLRRIPLNIIRFILLNLTAIVTPIISSPFLTDKIYIGIFAGSFLSIIILIILVFCWRRGALRLSNKGGILPFLMLLCISAVISLTRAYYIDSTISNDTLPSYFSYCVNAILIFAIYATFNFSKPQVRSLFLVALIYLILAHGVKTHTVCQKVARQTGALKEYFNAVSGFVSRHEKERDFSFKIIDRPPRGEVFGWYHETCIDGLFNRFINNKTPKYIVEYNYSAKELKYSIYDKNPRAIPTSSISTNFSKEADYINSVGIQFKKLSGQGYDFLMGMFEVTQKQWQDVMASHPSTFRNDSHPVENVSYHMAQEFIQRLNEIEGGDFYRLPTSEEYLNLVNQTIHYPSGKYKNIDEYAWFKDNAKGTTHLVGSLEAMPTGIYDLTGNVWEWTADMIYYDASVKPLRGSPHLCFGGSWRDKDINIDNLITNYPLDFRHEHLGFRLVRQVEESR